MRIAITIHTPGQAYFWSNIARVLINEGHQVFVLTRTSRMIQEILSHQGIKYATYGKSEKNTYGKLLHLPFQFWNSFRLISKFRPDIVVGASILESNTAALLRKPCIIFEDTEITPTLERLQWLITASSIVTPSCFRMDLGRKQVRIEGYKELGYLHPEYFKPDPSIFEELKIKRTDKYCVVRFNSFTAVHDVGLGGFTSESKITTVKTLEKYARVFVSAEGKLPAELEAYKLPTPPYRIHQVLNYAYLVVSDSGTMITEAAILGTPCIRCNAGVSSNELGNFIDLWQKYNLLYCSPKMDQVLPKALEFIQKPHIKEEWAEKRKKLLAEKIDVTRFMVDFIEQYPDCLKLVKDQRLRLLKSC